MSRQSLRELSGRKRLEDVFVAEVASHAFDNGLVLTDFGDDFAVVEVEVDVMRSYRQVPGRVVGEHG